MLGKMAPPPERMGSKAIASTTPTVPLIFFLILSTKPTRSSFRCTSRIPCGKKTTSSKFCGARTPSWIPQGWTSMTSILKGGGWNSPRHRGNSKPCKSPWKPTPTMKGCSSITSVGARPCRVPGLSRCWASARPGHEGGNETMGFHNRVGDARGRCGSNQCSRGVISPASIAKGKRFC